VLRYRKFLAVRDGEPNLLRHTLSRREAFFDGLAQDPVRSSVRIDRDTFLRNVVRRRPERGLDARMLWLLACAKVNQAERFGVGLAELYGRGAAAEGEPARLHVQVQETYHTRILADVVAMFGLPVYPRPPALLVRTFIKLLVALPESWNLPLAGCAEMAGCVIFRALRDRGLELFADEPQVIERIRLLYNEILADEISHVGFVAAQVGAGGRALMRRLYRPLALRLVSQLPELVALFGREELTRRVRASFRLDQMVAEFPGLAYAAALI
jgi:hypothetical protein